MPSVRTAGGWTGCVSHTDQRSKVQVQMISQQQKAGREEKRFSANGARAKNPISFHRGDFLKPLHSTALGGPSLPPCTELSMFAISFGYIHGKSLLHGFHILERSELSTTSSLQHLVGKGKMGVKGINLHSAEHQTMRPSADDSHGYLLLLHLGFLGTCWDRSWCCRPTPLPVAFCSGKEFAGHFHWVWLTTSKQQNQLLNRQMKWQTCSVCTILNVLLCDLDNMLQTKAEGSSWEGSS